ncbi:MAG TPA: hypothetical protein VFC93_15885 [Chloroflexota bacterium]|nr:hypothetical protein [Chloroflexota bacterium]
MSAAWQSVAAEWSIRDVGAFLLDSITGALYQPPEILREYCQNAIDSYSDLFRETHRPPINSVQVRIDPLNRSVEVFDRGIGMDLPAILQAKSIAVSGKLQQPDEYIGFRGIGIWSGLPACEQIVILTTKIDTGQLYKLVIDCADITKLIDSGIDIGTLMEGRFHIYATPWDADDHFTFVKLSNVQERYVDLLDEPAMTKYLSRTLPVPVDPAWPHADGLARVLDGVPWTTTYDVTVNGEPVYRRFPAKVKPPERVPLEAGGREVAVAWLAESTDSSVVRANERAGEVNNFRVRVKGMALGEPALFAGGTDPVTDASLLRWYVGEIIVTDDSVKPDTHRRGFQPSGAAGDVRDAIRSFYVRTVARARGWSVEKGALDLASNIAEKCDEIEQALGGVGDDDRTLRDALTQLANLQTQLANTKAKSNRTRDLTGASPAARAEAAALRKQQVKNAIAEAERRLSEVEAAVARQAPASHAVLADPPRSTRPTTRRTSRMGDRPVSTAAVVGTLHPPDGSAYTQGELIPRPAPVLVDLAVATQAFLAAARAVLGESHQAYQQIVARLPEELRLRGIAGG